MNYIEQIIEDLVDSSKTLVDPLLKTKVMANRICNGELLEWVNNELDGYRLKDEIEIPKYRRHGKQTFFYSYSRQGNIYMDQQVPLSRLDESFRDRIMFHEFEEGVQLLEEHASGKHAEYIVREFPLDMCNTITAQLKDAIPTIKVFKFRIMLHISEVTQVLGEIRNKLLGFICEIDKAFPDLDDLIKQKLTVKEEFQQRVTNIFQTHIYARDNNTIIHGSNNELIT
jgi:hypothetical protein